jgi:hypothetical protein
LKKVQTISEKLNQNFAWEVGKKCHVQDGTGPEVFDY